MASKIMAFGKLTARQGSRLPISVSNQHGWTDPERYELQLSRHDLFEASKSLAEIDPRLVVQAIQDAIEEQINFIDSEKASKHE